MLYMKKQLIMSVVALMGILFGSIGIESTIADTEVDVVHKNGFTVLDDGNKNNETTIVCKAVPNSDYGMKVDEYGVLTCVNVYDSADFVVLTPQQAKGVNYGDVLLVTFDGDDVANVQLNSLNIGDKVSGQKINK
ncbi:hypothetical protein AB3N02_22105 [Priestia aryabhattai]|uniref:hypothetical protein n=1 Tax=Priestia aryabhattai TaxID=412384 RepID=UPI0039A1580F